MPRIKPLTKEQSSGQIKEIFEGMSKQFGIVPNLFATIAKYPQALKPMLDLLQALAKKSEISFKLQELANLEVSRINRCNYCLTHHGRMARIQGLNKTQIETLKKGTVVENLSDKEKTVVEYSRQVTLDAESVSDELFNRLKSHFSDSQIVNLTLIIGVMNIFNRFNGALGVELEK